MIRKTNGSASTASAPRRGIALIGAVLCLALAVWVARAAEDPLTRTAQSYAADIATKAAATLARNLAVLRGCGNSRFRTAA